jgi:hypothetical protein
MPPKPALLLAAIACPKVNSANLSRESMGKAVGGKNRINFRIQKGNLYFLLRYILGGSSIKLSLTPFAGRILTQFA